MTVNGDESSTEAVTHSVFSNVAHFTITDKIIRTLLLIVTL